MPDEIASMKRSFLAVFERLGSAGLTARSLGISLSRHYRWLANDATYAAKWREAQEVFVGRLEREAYRRAVKGVERKKFHKDEPIIDPETGQQYVEREYSDQLLMFLMKANAPQKYRPVAENLPTQNNVNVGVGVTNQVNVGIRVIEDDNWYGNADRLAPQADAAHAAGVDVAESL